MMIEDLRDDADFVDEELDGKSRDTDTSSYPQKYFLGMTPVQRFVISIMILLMVCIMGAFFLLITESVSLPI